MIVHCLFYVAVQLAERVGKGISEVNFIVRPVESILELQHVILFLAAYGLTCIIRSIGILKSAAISAG